MLSGSPSEHSRRRTGPRRFFVAWGQAPRFARNVAISLPAFLFDLGLLFLLVRHAHLDYLVATVVSFLVAHGLSYFLAIAVLSAFAVTALMWLSVSVLHFEVIFSRIAAASIVGVGGYLLNLMVNFRVARTQVEAPRLGLQRPPRRRPA